MTRLNWGALGERFYEAGVDRGVLYVDRVGYAWPGLISVSESSIGGDPKSYYVDAYKYAQISAKEEFQAIIQAFSAPAEFAICDGAMPLHTGLIATQQPRRSFDFSYRTLIGNDLEGTDHGYKIHLVYNALAAPTNRTYNTIGADATPGTLSWSVSTRPPNVLGLRPTAHYVVDSRTSTPENLAEVEAMLYGTDEWNAVMPTVAELIGIFDDTFEYDGGTPVDTPSEILDGGVVL
jgi:hypothetical protein